MTIWERVAWPFAGVSAATFATLSALRGKRVFHPDGRAYEGRLTIRADALPPHSPIGTGPPARALVRFSRGAGLPQSVPDVLGLAIKLPDAYGAGSDQDFLLASSGSGLIAQNLLLPQKRFFHTTYSSVLPYRLDDGLVLFGARASGSLADKADATFADIEAAASLQPLDFEFLLADLSGSWRPIGSLVVERELDQHIAEELKFNPWNTSPEFEPAGALNALRRSAYRASQGARGADDETKGAS